MGKINFATDAQSPGSTETNDGGVTENETLNSNTNRVVHTNDRV